MSQQGLRRRVHLVAECIRFHSKIDRKFPLGQDNAGDIDALLAAHAKCKRELAEARKVVRLYLPLGSKEAMKYWAKKAGVKQEEKR